MSKIKFTYSVKTMGCKANIYDSMVIETQLTELGGVRALGTPPDLFVVNSCTVTAEADRQSLREVSQIKKKSPSTVTVVTGCLSQVDPNKVTQSPGVELVIPNDKKQFFKSLIANKLGFEFTQTDEDSEIFWGQLPTEHGKTRAFLKIQEGCNDYCTYCIIPYARGKSRSVRVGHIISEIQRLVLENGIQEVVLTGTNIGDYGKDFGHCLEDLIDAILEKTTLKRLRLTSLDPSEVSERILKLMTMTNRRLMPHLHISLQSPVSRVLRAMKRDYRTEEVVDALTRIHNASPDIYVGMDVIAGFPSETDQEHAEGVSILKQLPWTRLHVFPYSEREGTPATRITPVVPVHVRRERANELMALSTLRHEQFSKRFVGQTIPNVLFENWHEVGGDFFTIGHSENYLRIMARVPSRTQQEAELAHNTIRTARIVGASPKPTQDWTLESVLV